MRMTALVGALLISGAFGVAAQCLDQVGFWPHSAISGGAVVSSTYAASVDGHSLRIIDYTQAGAPVVGSLILDGVGEETRADGDFLYIDTGFDSITRVDVSDPTAPLITSTWEAPSWVSSLAADGGLVYVLTDDEVSVVDFSNPGTPATIGTLALPSGFYIAIDAVGDTAVVAGTDVYVIDVSDPTAPVVQGSVPLNPAIFTNSLAISGTNAYVVGFEGLAVVDISNPVVPVQNGSLPAANGQWVEAYGSWVYISHDIGEKGLLIVDASDPNVPVALPLIEFPQAPGFIHRFGDRMATGGDAFQVFDISNQDDPQEVASLGGWGPSNDVATTGTVALTAARYAGVLSFDLSDPTNPIEIGGIGTRRVEIVAISGDLAVAGTNGERGLQILDIADPAAPVELSFVPLSDLPRDVAIAGDIAYTALLNTGFAIVDLTIPSAPSVVDTINWSNQTNAVAVQDDLLLVGKNDRLLIYDITVPTSPVLLSSSNSVYVRSWGIAISGDLAYLAAGGNGLTVLSIADPTNPIELGRWTNGWNTSDVTVRPPLAYVTDTQVGLYAIDLSDPASPMEWGFWPTAYQAEAVAFTGWDIAMGDGSGGLVILKACGVIFADGFESEDTDAWSSSLPPTQ